MEWVGQHDWCESEAVTIRGRRLFWSANRFPCGVRGLGALGVVVNDPPPVGRTDSLAHAMQGAVLGPWEHVCAYFVDPAIKTCANACVAVVAVAAVGAMRSVL